MLVLSSCLLCRLCLLRERSSTESCLLWERSNSLYCGWSLGCPLPRDFSRSLTSKGATGTDRSTFSIVEISLPISPCKFLYILICVLSSGLYCFALIDLTEVMGFSPGSNESMWLSSRTSVAYLSFSSSVVWSASSSSERYSTVIVSALFVGEVIMMVPETPPALKADLESVSIREGVLMKLVSRYFFVRASTSLL